MQKLRKTLDRSNSLNGKEAARQLSGSPPEAKATGAGSASAPATETPPEYEELFGPPALSPETQTRRAAEDYHEHLQRFGTDVPEAVVSVFAEAYRLGREPPDQIEALVAGLRAGTTEKQRERAAGGDGR